MAMAKAKPFTKENGKSGLGCFINYSVDGFSWGHAIQVVQFMSNRFDAWEKPFIIRGYGGNRLEMEHFLTEENLMAALRDAIREAKRLDRRTGTKVKGKS